MASITEMKEQAAAAWAGGQFDAAIEHYTAALALAADAVDKDMLKTLLSNRSAAYMKVGRTQAALTDAIKCVEADSTWAKGYSRKGDALYAQAKYTEAYNAYNAGAVGDKALTEKAEMAMTAIRGAAAPSPEAGAGTAASGSGSRQLQSMQGIFKFLVIINAFLFAVPFLNRIAGLNHKIFVAAAFADFAIALISRHGKPQFNMAYAQRVLPDPTTMYLLMCIILFIGTPSLSAMLPILLLETAQFAYFLSQRGAEKYGGLLDKAAALVDKFVPSALGIVGWENMTASTKWSQFNHKIVEICSMFEVTQGLVLVFQLLFPTRNFIFTMMWWQYLQMRYMMDTGGSIKRAFWLVDGRISSLLAYEMCPEIVRTGYGKLKAFLSKQVQLPTAPAEGASGSGLLSSLTSKCTIS